jgi:acetolactate decarboxylase
LLEHGDTGLGTFNGLDGEMIVLNGRVSQVRSDGRVYQPDSETTTPFAVVSWFEPDQAAEIAAPCDLGGLERAVDQLCPDQNTPVAFKFQGSFESAECRSVPAQRPPYPPLAEVVKGQKLFNRARFDGTIVGFRCPPFAKGVNAPGYHMHLLSNDGRFGGHLLSCRIAKGVVMADICGTLIVKLPAAGSNAGLDLGRDRAAELDAVER